MDEKTDVMVALAAAVGANCIPCFDKLLERALELGVKQEDIGAVVETANKVKTGASIFMKNAVNETLGIHAESEQPCCSREKTACC